MPTARRSTLPSADLAPIPILAVTTRHRVRTVTRHPSTSTDLSTRITGDREAVKTISHVDDDEHEKITQ